jgi:hypothetical protein
VNLSAELGKIIKIRPHVDTMVRLPMFEKRDRVELHESITKRLGLGTTIQCRFQRQCILAGELLVWNDRNQQILPLQQESTTRDKRGTLTKMRSCADPCNVGRAMPWMLRSGFHCSWQSRLMSAQLTGETGMLQQARNRNQRRLRYCNQKRVP